MNSERRFVYTFSSYKNNSYSGNKYAGYRHIFCHKQRNRASCGLTLSYIPATQADADLIASYLPKPHADGSPILPSELPTSLPGYLINLKAQINLDGVAVATSSTALPMGTTLASTGGFTQLSDPTQWDLTSEESNVVGQATAIGISAGGISAVQLTQLKDRLTITKNKLQIAAANPNNAEATLASLTGEQVSGDLLTATIWSWFKETESHNNSNQNLSGMIENQGLSYGLSHGVARPIYSWGVIRKVNFTGHNLDIGHVRSIGWSKNDDRNTWIVYNKMRGQYMSALEHSIPERFFNNPSKCNTEGITIPVAGLPICPQGISAVKAISIATSQGQKIYKITPEVFNNNPSIVATQLFAHSYTAQQAVQNALYAGHEVTIHEKPITQSGWTGAGYTTIDPSTGAGGYMIDGGSNGGALEFIDNLQKYLFTPHITGFAQGAGYKAFSTSFGNFAGVFSFVVDLLSFMDRCSGDDYIAAIIMWTVYTLISLLALYLIFAIFAVAFITELIIGILINLFMDFVIKDAHLDYVCPVRS